MSQVFIINEDGSTQSMNRVHCKSEDRELQLLLEMNPTLLSGDQIDPEDPRRWLIIQREMPVPDPTTGADRWSIDFVLADQSAIPTFVECKRYRDSRARREVIGQVFEYAANGQYYWTREEFESYAKAAAQSRGVAIEEAIRELQPDQPATPDEFFARVEENLREGQIRIVFFLEEAPMELKCIVDFLNKQMERTEVLLVEARQFSHNGFSVVSPTLFGFTEEARRVKRRVNITVPSQKKTWNEGSFFADAVQRLSATDASALHEFFNYCKISQFDLSFGTGATIGSFMIKLPPVCPRSILSVWSSGTLWLNFGGINGSEQADSARDFLKGAAERRLNLIIPDDFASKFPSYPIEEWAGKVSALISVLNDFMHKCVSLKA